MGNMLFVVKSQTPSFLQMHQKVHSGQKYSFVRYDKVLLSRASFQAGIERELPPALQSSSHGQVTALEIEFAT